MRNFNEEEQGELKIIVETFQSFNESGGLPERTSRLAIWRFMLKITSDIDCVIDFDRNTKVVTVFGEHYKSLDYQFQENCLKIYYRIVLLISLFRYLEENHLAYFFKLPYAASNKVMNEQEELVSVFKNRQRVSYANGLARGVLPIEGESEFIFRLLETTVVPTPELIEFVTNDFKDKEQIRHEENLKQQGDALSISKDLGDQSIKIADKSMKVSQYSLVIALVSLIITCFQTCQSFAQGRSNNLTNNSEKKELNKGENDSIHPKIINSPKLDSARGGVDNKFQRRDTIVKSLNKAAIPPKFSKDTVSEKHNINKPLDDNNKVNIPIKNSQMGIGNLKIAITPDAEGKIIAGFIGALFAMFMKIIYDWLVEKYKRRDIRAMIVSDLRIQQNNFEILLSDMKRGLDILNGKTVNSISFISVNPLSSEIYKSQAKRDVYKSFGKSNYLRVNLAYTLIDFNANETTREIVEEYLEGGGVKQNVYISKLEGRIKSYEGAISEIKAISKWYKKEHEFF